MTRSLHARLARLGLKNNRRITLPYILTAAAMVMLFYIVFFLANDEEIRHIKGGTFLQMWMAFGIWVIGIFSVIFLFYTNSFIMKHRRRELGLYNILGMDKFNLARVLGRETLFTSAVSIAAGLAAGILLSKLAQLMLFRLMGEDAPLSFSVNPMIALVTVAVYAGIFLLVHLRSLLTLGRSDPLALFRDAAAGEREPKGNILLALLGILTLGGGYYIAVTVTDVYTAITFFFYAVILVIVGTYYCFISGSVTALRLMRKNKRFYYKPRHFVNVSGMIYRMRRSGAGLASITILATMVLVMLSSTSCLTLGSEAILNRRYPRSFSFTSSYSDANPDTLRADVDAILAERALTPENAIDYHYGSAVLFRTDGALLGPEEAGSSAPVLVEVYPLADYNRAAGTSLTLAPGEAYLDSARPKGDEIRLPGGTVRVRERFDFAIPASGTALTSAYPVVRLILPDEASCLRVLDTPFLYARYAFDLDLEPETAADTARELLTAVTCERKDCSILDRAEFYSMYAGLFALAILLAVAFLLAAVLIMYYKQITEGYEDQARFGVMRRVGMTDDEIRASINAQVLTIFFLPLGAATLHMAFAFPLVSRILRIFGLTDTGMLLALTAASIAAFALFYLVVYRITSRAYYRIVRTDAH